MKTKLLAIIFLAGSSLFAGTHVSVGIGFGPSYGYAYGPAYTRFATPPPPPVVNYYAPPAPAPGYVWVNGYWYPNGPRYAWRGGYWARPPYVGARWYGPRYHGGRYYRGYWRR